ncbi:hypothetical protein DAEQUDRAFT_124885 [Daedalea quercina L-15889]|uniref:Uncharacterized protein n=1 Tax=Daedalea quercina L-15889 TaxID=1314783 RepID=A0A165RYS5_9APHY|nr:hypothetical protein DAEQUDRAFT_124885 [Daedalea quercina L-15889]
MHEPPPSASVSPPASSSSSSTPPPSPGGHHHRAHPHLATLLPHPPHPHLPHHHHHHHHSMYSPSSRAADISRLLDPAYASGSSSSDSSTRTRVSAWASPAHRATVPPDLKYAQTQTRAYVDHHGDLHDPDYRDFPVLPMPTRPTRSHNQRGPSAASAAAHRSRSASRPRYSPSYALITRPEWERHWATELDGDGADDVDEEDEVTDADSQSHYSPFSTASRASPRRAVTIHTTQPYTGYAPYSDYSDYHADPQTLPTTTPPSGSHESPITESPLEDSPFDPDELDPSPDAGRKRQKRQSTGYSSLLRKRRATDSKEDAVTEDRGVSADAGADADVTTEKEERPPQKTRFTVAGAQGDDVYVCRLPLLSPSLRPDPRTSRPTCSVSLQQQWAAISLRIRFGLFHAKRRLSVRSRRYSTSDAP